MSQNPPGYSGLQIGLHWSVAALVIFQFVAHDAIAQAWRAFAGGIPPDPDGKGMVALHIICGALIFLLALWRPVAAVAAFHPGRTSPSRQ